MSAIQVPCICISVLLTLSANEGSFTHKRLQFNRTCWGPVGSKLKLRVKQRDYNKDNKGTKTTEQTPTAQLNVYFKETSPLHRLRKNMRTSHNAPVGYCLRRLIVPPEVNVVFGFVESLGDTRKYAKFWSRKMAPNWLYNDWRKVHLEEEKDSCQEDQTLRTYKRLEGQSAEFLWQHSRLFFFTKPAC